MLEEPFEIINNQDANDEQQVTYAIMQAYNLCKYSILNSCLYKIPMAVLEGQSKYFDPSKLGDLIVEAANLEDRAFI